MATLQERFELQPSLRPRVTMALAAALVTILREAPSGTDDAKRRLRVRQRWAVQAMGDQDRSAVRVTQMIAAAAPDGQIDDGLSDGEIVNLVSVAVDALAAVELRAPDETLPAP